MQVTNKQSQNLVGTFTSQTCTEFNENQYISYLALEEKISARLYNSDINLDSKMIECFFTRLLPVTFREWNRR